MKEIIEKKYHKFLSELRDKASPESISLSSPCDVTFNKELLQATGNTTKKIQIIFTATGCSKALSNNGPCTMCGFINESNFGKHVSPENLIKQFENAIKDDNFKKSSIVSLLNSGSIFCEAEFPKKAREYIFNKLNNSKNIEEVIFESRPEFVNEKNIKETKELLKNKKIVLAIGLEFVTDIVRDEFINKGFSKKDFEKAVKIANKYSVNTHSYVLLKPPFLTEKEAIDEAVKTINYCNKMGLLDVTLMPCGVQKNTLTEFLHKNNEYRPPWLWSVIEVINKVGKDKFIRLDSGVDNVTHLNEPHNCDKCNKKVLGVFNEYNKKRNSSVFKMLTCECKEEWEEELKIKNLTPFTERVERFLLKYKI